MQIIENLPFEITQDHFGIRWITFYEVFAPKPLLNRFNKSFGYTITCHLCTREFYIFLLYQLLEITLIM